MVRLLLYVLQQESGSRTIDRSAEQHAEIEWLGDARRGLRNHNSL
mgnify:FL=1